MEDSPKPTRLSYPETRRSDHVDTYHGQDIADPYRWLEDTHSKDTAAWVDAQNKVTFGYLAKSSKREDYKQRLTELWDFERFGLPRKRGELYFFTRNDGLQNQSVLYVSKGLNGEPRKLLDPNTLSEDGTVALSSWSVSDDGKWLAYGLATAGSDWRQWRVLDVVTGKTLPDHLRWVKFSGVSWLPNGAGFFYSRYDEPKEGEEFSEVNFYQKLYFHKLGDEQENDRLVYQRADEKEWGFGGSVTEDGRYLIISVWRGTERKNQVFYQEIDSQGIPTGKTDDGSVVELVQGFDAEYSFLGNHGATFFFATDLDAPKQRVVALDTAKATPGAKSLDWETLIAERDDVLRGISLVGDHFIARYLHDAHTLVRVHDRAGSFVREVDLPAIGSAGGFGGREDQPETFYSFTNYTTPGTIYQYNVATGEQTLFRQPKVPFDPSSFETKQVFVESKDGTKVPVFITHRKGLKLDGSNPTLLYGYGGFDIPLTPSFSVRNVVWLEQGGVYAVANLRGGGEYGREWHEAGMKDRKQNVFDDFISAARWLIESKHTDASRLAIQGGSNGGLLVGAAMTQEPDLFAAALPSVGVMDMLRFHKFTIGWAWVSEYGSSDDAAEYKNLVKYSPLHNLKPGVRYPATMVMTADHDDRVVPGHSFKFAAQLQHCHQGPEPVVIRIEKSAGHGAGTPTSKLIQAAADQLAFLQLTLEP